jgi:hypothetical protein
MRWMVLALAACRSNIVAPDGGAPHSAPTHSAILSPTGDTGPAPATDCAFAGSWVLSDVKCGAFPYPTFYDTYMGATMTITQDPAGGCDVVAKLTSETCAQIESWDLGPPAGTDVEVTRNGVTECRPADCSHGETACTVGANIAPPETVLMQVIQPYTMSAVGLFAETAPTCLPDLGLATVWTQL